MNLQYLAHHTKAHTFEMNTLGILVIFAVTIGLAVVLYVLAHKNSDED